MRSLLTWHHNHLLSQNFRSDAYARRCDLQQMLSTGKVLSDKEGEDLSDLEDRLDGIVTEVDYVTQQINESKTQLERAEASAAKMRRLVGSLSQRETQQVLALYLNAVVEMQGKERRDAHRITELEVDLAERAARIDQLASGIKVRDLEYDVRTTRLEEEHASKMQDVFSHLNLALVAEKGGGVRREKWVRGREPRRRRVLQPRDLGSGEPPAGADGGSGQAEPPAEGHERGPDQARQAGPRAGGAEPDNVRGENFENVPEPRGRQQPEQEPDGRGQQLQEALEVPGQRGTNLQVEPEAPECRAGPPEADQSLHLWKAGGGGGVGLEHS